jgi:5-methylcytosine-specific restriction endonuclease McrA
LEIDHKKPVAKGGLNAIANLQVLCRSCNRGKAAKAKKIKKTIKRSRTRISVADKI